MNNTMKWITPQKYGVKLNLKANGLKVELSLSLGDAVQLMRDLESSIWKVERETGERECRRIVVTQGDINDRIDILLNELYEDDKFDNLPMIVALAQLWKDYYGYSLGKHVKQELHKAQEHIAHRKRFLEGGE